MSYPPFSRSSVITPRVYESIDSSIEKLALEGQGNRVEYTVDMMDWPVEQTIEEPGITPIGVAREFGSAEGEGFARFTVFDSDGEVILSHLDDPFTGLRGQMEIEKVSRGAQLQATLRTVRRRGQGRIHLSVNGRMEGERRGGSLGHEFYRFAGQFGLESMWQQIETNPLEVSLKGWIDSRIARPIATALGAYVIPRT